MPFCKRHEHKPFFYHLQPKYKGQIVFLKIHISVDPLVQAV